MRTVFVILVLMLASLGAYAADVTLSWAAPTTNTDGSVPPLIGGYNLYQAATDAALTALPDTIHGGKTLSVGKVLSTTLKNVPPGTYVYAVTTWYCPPGLSGQNCFESAQSAHASTTIAAPVITPATPSAPASVKVTVSVSAP